MKRSQHSLTKIYADPHIIALTNRINFIQKRRAKQLIQIQSIQSPSKKQNNLSIPMLQTGYKKRLLRTEEQAYNQATKRERQQNNCSKALLNDLKTARYRQCKQNSERNMIVIRQNKEREMNLKKIKRSKVLVSHERGRAKLQQFQKSKLKQLQQRNDHHWADQRVQLKKMELKKQLLAQEDKFLNLFQQQLAQKSVLMKKIEKFLRNQSDDIKQ